MADIYARLRAPAATLPDEICSCSERPIKLMWALSENPIHCLDCNLEIVPEALPLPPELVDRLPTGAG
jgi:hypothetical protein